MKVKIGNYGRGDRKIDVNIENFDTWSLDHTLSLIILPALIQLKHSKHGIPGKFVDSYEHSSQYCFEFITETSDDVFKIGVDMWNETLDKMIWSFQQIALNDDIDTKYRHGTTDFSWKKINNGSYELIDKNPDGHWYDHVGHQIHYERIQEGLNLFTEYFLDLWD